MIPGREDYIPPVDFASEPADLRRRWIGRIILVLFVIGLLLMLWFKVLNPSDTSQVPNDPLLPGPR